jgi:hypothetical protein
MLDEQARHIGHIIREVEGARVRTLEASAGGRGRVGRHHRQAGSRARQKFLNACTPGYYNNEGKPNERTARNSQFWRGPMVFIRMLKWRQDGTMPGLNSPRCRTRVERHDARSRTSPPAARRQCRWPGLVPGERRARPERAPSA